MFVIDNHIRQAHPGPDAVLHPGNLKPLSNRASFNNWLEVDKQTVDFVRSFACDRQAMACMFTHLQGRSTIT